MSHDARAQRAPAAPHATQPTRSLAATAAALLLAILCGVSLVRDAPTGLFTHAGMDFLSTYTAARLVEQGDARHLYNLRAQRAVQAPIVERYGEEWSDRGVQPFIAPPVLALIALPLARLSPPLALAAWLAASVALIAVAARLLDRTLGLGLGWLALPLALSFFPTYYGLLLGQSEGLLLVAVALFVVLILQRRDLPAGLALAALAIKPPLLLVPAIYLVVKRRWRALGALGAACLAAAAASAWLIGERGIRDYLDLTRKFGQPAGTPQVNVFGMINVRGTVVRLLPDAPATVQQVAIAALTLALLAVAVPAWRRSASNRTGALPQALPAEASEIAQMLATTLLVSYHTLVHTGTLLLPALALLWAATGRPAGPPSRERGLLRALLGLAWLGPALAFVPTGTSSLPAVVLTTATLGLWLLAADLLVAAAPAAQPLPVRSRRSEQRW